MITTKGKLIIGLFLHTVVATTTRAQGPVPCATNRRLPDYSACEGKCTHDSACPRKDRATNCPCSCMQGDCTIEVDDKSLDSCKENIHNRTSPKYKLIIQFTSNVIDTLLKDKIYVVITKGFTGGTESNVAWQVINPINIHAGKKEITWGEVFKAGYTTSKMIGDVVIVDKTPVSRPFGARTKMEIDDTGWLEPTECAVEIPTQFCIDYLIQGDPLHLVLMDGGEDEESSVFFYDEATMSYGQEVRGYVPAVVTVSLEREVKSGQFIGKVSDDKLQISYTKLMTEKVCVFKDSTTGGIDMIRGECAEPGYGRQSPRLKKK